MKNSVFILLLIVVTGCVPDDDMHRTIYFKNNSDYKVWIEYSTLYPDTITDPPGYFGIAPHFIGYFDQKSGYEYLINLNKEKKNYFVCKER